MSRSRAPRSGIALTVSTQRSRGCSAPAAAPPTAPLPVLAVGASDSTTFTGTYMITQADIDTGSVEDRKSAV